MNNLLIRTIVILGLVILLGNISSFLVNQVQGKELEPGDIVIMRPEKWNPSPDDVHVAMYIGKYDGMHMFVESGGLGVWPVPWWWLDLSWKDFDWFSVYYDDGETELSKGDKKLAVEWALDMVSKPYQKIYRGHICHYDLDDKKLIDKDGIWCRGEDKTYHPPLYWPSWPWFAKLQVQYRMVPCFTCMELVWAAYKAGPEIDIVYDEEGETENVFPYDEDFGLGKCYYGVWPHAMWDADPGVEDKNVKIFQDPPENAPLSLDETDPNGVVDGNLNEDDPENNTWTTIQKGIDNLTTLDVLYVKNGTYCENVLVDKSLTITGENREKVIIEGSVTIKNSQDYELPDGNKYSLMADLEMSSNELLLHFNNDADVGENYSSSALVYDYSVLGSNTTGNNGTINEVILNTSALKGNGSLDFDGVDDYVNISNVSALAGENVTISAWIYWNGGSGAIDPIVSQSNDTHGYCLYVNSSDNKPAFRLDEDIAVSSVSINNGWHYIVGTHNETTLKIFVDGEIRGTAEKTGSGFYDMAYVGFDNVSDYFDGTIEEVAVWNEDLPEDLITRVYTLSYGVTISNLTIKNSTIGLVVDNRSEIYDCNLINHSIGAQFENATAVLCTCNISDCDTGISIVDSNPEEIYTIRISYCDIDNCSHGAIINSSSNIYLFASNFNCSNTNLSFNDCNHSTIQVVNCTSIGNTPPDTPSLSGHTLGEPETSYTYYTVANDSDNEQLYYQFYWGDENESEILGPYSSNVTVNASHTWEKHGGYYIYVIAKDVFYNESWSEPILFRTETLPPLINFVNHTPDPVGYGEHITITANVTDDTSGNYSGIQIVRVNITYPDNSTGNHTMNDIGNNTYEYNFSDTWLIGQYNYTILAVDNAYNTNSSTGHSFTVKHLFGYTIPGSLNQSVEDRITGSVFTVNANGTADNITAYIQTNLTIPPKTECMIYRNNDSTLVGTADELTPDTGLDPAWVVFNFSGTKPALVKNTEYVLSCWSNDTCYLFYDICTDTIGRYNGSILYGDVPDPINWTGNESREHSIYCSYTTKPEITNVSASPVSVGFGFNITVSADVEDYGCGIDTVKVNVTYPDASYGNFTMNYTENNTYEYLFSDTWLVDQYNYSIWACDSFGSCSTSSGESFNVSAQATISVCTIKGEYGENEFINLTDPPGEPPLIGYEMLDDGGVLHMWNPYNHYYFNTSSGIQLTNHYDEYWSHNVLMLGYYNNDEWNLIYRTDELSGFTKDTDTDNETYVNATLWKDLTYQGYAFRLAIRYHLGLDDWDLTVIPYIKNLGIDIPYNLGFGWEIKDIKIADTYENDWIRLYNGTNWTSYRLDQTLDKQYTDMDYNTSFYLEGRNEGKYFRRTLYLKWNYTLDYLVRVKSRTGQHNAPVTLFIKIGTLGEGQEKYTMLNWLDSDDWLGVGSSELVYACEMKGMLMGALDGQDMWSADTDHEHEFILDLGRNYSIKKFRGRSESDLDPTDVDIYISTDNSTWGTAVASDISTWQDTFTWAEVDSTDKVGQYVKVVIQTTEDENRRLVWGLTPPETIIDLYGCVYPNTPPAGSNPYPPDNSTGISISPMLNISVSDAEGDNMNITWSSNSSGDWIAFGTNNSVSNGTYHQTFTNASVNGRWWYWKVNVTDGDNYTESNVYMFYTGSQSKINNTGSTTIKGYLLIQVQFYNETSEEWEVAADTINETAPRTIYSEVPDSQLHILALDSVFNDLVNSSDLSSYGNGTYRIYAAFRDPDGNILVCDDENELVATYEFTITFD